MLDKFQVIFSGTEGSEPVRVEVRAWLAKLAPLIEGASATGGHVLIEAAYQHRHGAGWRYQATLDLTTSTGVTAISAQTTGNNPSDDIYVAVRNVFRCLRRSLLEDQEKRERGPTTLQTEVQPAALVGLIEIHLDTSALPEAEGPKVVV